MSGEARTIADALARIEATLARIEARGRSRKPPLKAKRQHHPERPPVDELARQRAKQALRRHGL